MRIPTRRCRRTATWWWLTWRLLVAPCRTGHAHAVLSVHRVCEHLLTILLTWSLTDSLLEMVTPSILIVDTRRMSGSDDGWMSWHFLFLSIITISADLPRLRVRLLTFDHSSMLSNSRVRLSILIAGTKYFFTLKLFYSNVKPQLQIRNSDTDALYDLRSASRLAWVWWVNGTAVHYVAIHFPQ